MRTSLRLRTQPAAVPALRDTVIYRAIDIGQGKSGRRGFGLLEAVGYLAASAVILRLFAVGLEIALVQDKLYEILGKYIRKNKGRLVRIYSMIFVL